MPERMPWAKWEWDRWENEETLRECSLAAQGLWMRMLCTMSKAGGKLLINGRPPSVASIARLAFSTPEIVLPLLEELEREGVYSRAGEDRVIYCRRMAKGLHKSRNGKKGAAAKALSAQADSGLLQLESESESESPLPPDGGPVRERDVEEVWALASETSQGRSSKPQLREAMEAAFHRGHKVAAMVAGARGYFRSQDARREAGRYVMGVHRLIQRDRFVTFAKLNVVSIAEASPWPARIRSWTLNRYWDEIDWGPKPGKPGCLCPPEFLPKADPPQAQEG